MERPEAAPGDFFALLKPRVLSLVVFSGLAGLLVAPGEIHPLIAAVAVLCVGVGAGASGAINMWYDRDIDAVMERTRQRPIPMGRVAPGDALGFGVVLATGAVALMGLAVNLRPPLCWPLPLCSMFSFIRCGLSGVRRRIL